jgi:hypothetical protein
MTDPNPDPFHPGEPEPETPPIGPEPEEPYLGPAPGCCPGDRDAWKLVYFGQISRDLVPFHPEPPEAPEDELTRAALSDPDSQTRGEPGHDTRPTLWRLLAVLAVAVIALGLVFWRTH